MSIKLLVILIVCFSVCCGTEVTVSGYFNCSVPNPDPTSLTVIIELMEEDNAYLYGDENSWYMKFPDPDDKLGEVIVDYKQRFVVTGHETEVVELEPYLMIHHRCGRQKGESWKTFRYQLDPVFSLADEAKRVNTGVIDLNPK